MNENLKNYSNDRFLIKKSTIYIFQYNLNKKHFIVYKSKLRMIKYLLLIIITQISIQTHITT